MGFVYNSLLWILKTLWLINLLLSICWDIYLQFFFFFFFFGGGGGGGGEEGKHYTIGLCTYMVASSGDHFENPHSAFLKWFQGGLRLFAGVWSVKCYTFNKMIKGIG